MVMKKMKLNERLKQLRKDAGLSQEQVSERMAQRNMPVKMRTLSDWETGRTKPSVEYFMELCDVYGVHDVRLAFTGIPSVTKTVDILDGLNPHGRDHAKQLIDMLRGNTLFSSAPTPGPSRRPVAPRSIRLYEAPVSAGKGSFLYGSDFETMAVDGTVPRDVSFAVRVHGDSMEPRFVDGQIVFVHEQPTLYDGEIGVFRLNEDAYLKKLDRGQLMSLNPAYDPIPIHDHDDFQVFGKVVG